MDNTKHTPGPWHSVDGDVDGSLLISKLKEDGSRYDVYATDADRAIIKAAPIMLVSLELIRDALDGQTSAAAACLKTWCDTAISEARESHV